MLGGKSLGDTQSGLLEGGSGLGVTGPGAGLPACLPLWNADHEGGEGAIGEVEHLGAGAAAHGWGAVRMRQFCKEKKTG